MFGLTFPTVSSLGEPLLQNGASEWRRPACGFILSLPLFETITGLTIYLPPFSTYNQFAVLAHTVMGILPLPVIFWYVGTHWGKRFRENLSHCQLLGCRRRVTAPAAMTRSPCSAARKSSETSH